MKSVLVRVFPLQGSAAELLDVLQERFSLVAGSVQREGNVLVVVGVRPRAPGFRLDVTEVTVASGGDGHLVTAQVRVLPGGSVWALTIALLVGGFLSFGAAFLFIPVPFIVYALSRRSVLPVIARVLGR